MMPARRIRFAGKPLKVRELEVEAGEAGLHLIRDAILAACQQCGLRAQEAHNLRLAVDEAASNIYRHAYGEQSGKVIMRISFFRKCLSVELVDQGTSFNWHGAKTPDLNRYVADRKKGGLGIWFIRKLTDASDYRTLSDGNHLWLWKRLHEPMRQEKGGDLIPHSRRKQSLRAVFVTRSVIFLGVLTLIIFTYGGYRVRLALKRRYLENASATAQNMAASSLDNLYKQQDLLLSDLAKDVLEHDSALQYATIVNSEGRVLGDGDLSRLFKMYTPIPGAPKVLARPQEYYWVEPLTGRRYYDVSVAIRDGGRLFGEVHVGLKVDAMRAAITREFWGLFWMLILVLGVGGAGSWILVKVIISPIRVLTEGVVAIGEGKLDHRIDIPGHDEFGQIASAFNEMAYKFSGAQKGLVEQEAMKKELQVAKVIQETLLPKELPRLQGYDVSSIYRSAKDVGGDYYDFIDVDRKRLGICVADVSGKGVPGSLVMTMIRTCIRLEARSNPSPARVLAQVNEVVTKDMKRGMFVTLFYLVLDSYKREIRYASAGHDPLILYRAATQRTYFLKPKGFPLGISLPDGSLFARSLKEQKVHLAKGDILVAYTDGIVEAMNSRREQFGMARFLNLIRSNAHLSSAQFVDKVNEEIHLFTGDYPQNDDITLVAVKEGMSQMELQADVRQKLTDLIEKQRLSVAEACRRVNLTPATWYYFKRQRRRFGRKRALAGRARVREELKLVSLEERDLLYPIIAGHPEWGGRELSRELVRSTGNPALVASVVDDDLERLKLATAEARHRFAARWKQAAQPVAALPAAPLALPEKAGGEPA